MAKRRIELGPTGERLRRNVRRFRELRNLTLAELSRRLSDVGRPLGLNTVSEIETGARRVDVDDLLSLAAALRVNSNALLLPPLSGPDFDVTVSGAGVVNSQLVWNWSRGLYPLDRSVYGAPDDQLADSMFRADIAPKQVPSADERLARTRGSLQIQVDELRLTLSLVSEADRDGPPGAELRRQIGEIEARDPRDRDLQVRLGLLPADVLS